MNVSFRSALALTLSLAALAPCAFAQAPQTFTPKSIVQWGQGGDRERGMLTQMGYAQLAQGQFGLSVADLNADGRPEIIVTTLSACDGAGCPVVALQSGGAGKVTQIFAQKVAGRLAITNEKVNGYNAFAAADQAGAIIKDPMGKPLVYPVGTSGQAAATPPAAAPPATAAARPPAAAPAPAAALAVPAAPAAPSGAPSPRMALATGTGQPAWQTSGAEYLPVCMFPRCLNPKIVEKTGVGTDKAAARGEVTVEDATRWCGLYMPKDRLCAQTEIANGGTAGGMTGRAKDPTAVANCVAGMLRAIDGFSYKYAGTWPDGAGKGRVKFDGTGVGSRIFEQQGARQMESGAQSIYEIARDPNSGEALAIQWEILCKGAAPPAR
jgi:hypothetical protein